MTRKRSAETDAERLEEETADTAKADADKRIALKRKADAQQGMECPAKADAITAASPSTRKTGCALMLSPSELDSNVINAWVFGNDHLTHDSCAVGCCKAHDACCGGDRSSRNQAIIACLQTCPSGHAV